MLVGEACARWWGIARDSVLTGKKRECSVCPVAYYVNVKAISRVEDSKAMMVAVKAGPSGHLGPRLQGLVSLKDLGIDLSS